MDEFAEYVDETKTISISGNVLKIAVKAKDAGRFFLALKGLDENNEAQVDKISDLATKMIKAGNKDMDNTEISRLVMYNFPEIIKELSIALGFATREAFESKNQKSQ